VSGVALATMALGTSSWPIGTLASPSASRGMARLAGLRLAAATTVVVQPGETLWSLAQRYQTTVSALAEVNQIADPNLIVAGTTLRLPGGASTQAVVTGDVVQAPDGGSLQAQFAAAASEEGVSVALLKAITWQESGWDNAAVSPAGAIGMGQLMPATIDFVNAVLVNPPLDPSVPAENLVMTAAFLRYLASQTGSLEGTICAYYQGLGSYQRLGVLPQSEQYVADVLALTRRFGG
jgi:soluble lytic murein transglycosylase-like protein